MVPAIVALAGVGGFVLGGLALRGSRVVSSTTTIGASDAVVYELLADLKSGWTRWSPLLTTAASGANLEYGEKTSGPGATVAWAGKAGKGSLTLTEGRALQGLSYRTTMALGGLVATGSIVLRLEDAGTVVTWTDELSVGANPLWRWLAVAMDSMRQKNLERGLAELKRVSEEAR